VPTAPARPVKAARVVEEAEQDLGVVDDLGRRLGLAAVVDLVDEADNVGVHFRFQRCGQHAPGALSDQPTNLSV
jgi:hypothetical protein